MNAEDVALRHNCYRGANAFRTFFWITILGLVAGFIAGLGEGNDLIQLVEAGVSLGCLFVGRHCFSVFLETAWDSDCFEWANSGRMWMDCCIALEILQIPAVLLLAVAPELFAIVIGGLEILVMISSLVATYRLCQVVGTAGVFYSNPDLIDRALHVMGLIILFAWLIVLFVLAAAVVGAIGSRPIAALFALCALGFFIFVIYYLVVYLQMLSCAAKTLTFAAERI